jgi:hypothetical protein
MRRESRSGLFSERLECVCAADGRKQEVSRDWVRGELLDLLLKYPGGVTHAIAQTHIFSKIQQNRQKVSLTGSF